MSYYTHILQAIDQANYQWLLFYQCMSCFAAWDAYRDARYKIQNHKISETPKVEGMLSRLILEIKVLEANPLQDKEGREKIFVKKVTGTSTAPQKL